MKNCPNCQANIEGLVYRCDCCGALLEQQKRLFACGIYELPQCLGFSSLTYEMVDVLQPRNPEKYGAFLDQVGISMVCYPEWMLMDGNIKNRLYYSAQKKYAGLTITVNYNEFICADKEGKAKLVATALLQGIHLLQTRLLKSGLNIDEIATHANERLLKYLKRAG